MNANIQIMIGASTWRVCQRGVTLFEAPATDAGIPHLLRHLPPGRLLLWLDRPDEEIVQFDCNAQSQRDRVRLTRKRLSVDQCGAWGRVLVWPQPRQPQAILIRLEQPGVVGRLATALMQTGRPLAQCLSHTLTLTAAAAIYSGPVLVIAPGLVDGVRHVLVRSGRPVFTRLCPGTVTDATARSDLSATLQHLVEKRLWAEAEPLECQTAVTFTAELEQRYPAIHSLPWTPLPTKRRISTRTALYCMPDPIQDYNSRMQYLSGLHCGAPALAVLALLGALGLWQFGRANLAEAQRLADRSPAPVRPLTPDQIDLAAVTLLAPALHAPRMLNALQQVSQVLQGVSPPALERVEWQLTNDTAATLALSFAPAASDTQFATRLGTALRSAGITVARSRHGAQWQLQFAAVAEDS